MSGSPDSFLDPQPVLYGNVWASGNADVGETIAEPVIPGTNRAGIESGADILSHPGLITVEDAALAAEKGVALEISSRKGHGLSNGHVAKVAMITGASMVINTDAHGAEDLITREMAKTILQAAGISRIRDINRILKNFEKIVDTFRRS